VYLGGAFYGVTDFAAERGLRLLDYAFMGRGRQAFTRLPGADALRLLKAV